MTWCAATPRTAAVARRRLNEGLGVTALILVSDAVNLRL